MRLKPESKTIHRGDIFYADLSPVVGSEQGGIRPVLILQNNTGNRHSPTVIAAAITGSLKKKLPTHVDIGCIENLYKQSFVLLEQIRTLDKSRLQRYIGHIDGRKMDEINEALLISVGVDPANLCLRRYLL